MTINLSKGGSINLSKEAPSLTNVVVGLGWKDNSTDTGADFDLDASAFVLDTNERLISDKHLIFYNNLISPDTAMVHSVDDLTGGDTADGSDNETIKIDLAKLESGVDKIAFIVTIHEADKRKQNFGQVKDAYIRLVDEKTGTEIARYDLGEDFGSETSMEFATLYKYNGDWKFKAIGTGHHQGLKQYVEQYGLTAKE